MVSTIEKDNNNNNNNSSIIRIKKTVKNLRIYTRHTKERFHSHTIYALIYFSIKLFYELWIDDVRGHELEEGILEEDFILRRHSSPSPLPHITSNLAFPRTTLSITI